MLRLDTYSKSQFGLKDNPDPELSLLLLKICFSEAKVADPTSLLI